MTVLKRLLVPFVVVILFFAFASFSKAEVLTGVPASSEITNVNSKKIMIVVHGGAWTGVGREYMEALRPYALLWQKSGWTTVNVDYRPGAQSVNDVVRIYDLARAKYGINSTICITGQSAGAHLAMMVAVRRANLDCAISEAGPVSLSTLRNNDPYEVVWDGKTFSHSAAMVVYNQLVVPVFGSSAANIKSVSPLDNISSIKARLFLSVAGYDPLISPYQVWNFQNHADQNPSTKGRVKSMVLPQATAQSSYLWVHGYTTNEAAYKALYAEYETATAAYNEKQANQVADPPVVTPPSDPQTPSTPQAPANPVIPNNPSSPNLAPNLPNTQANPLSNPNQNTENVFPNSKKTLRIKKNQKVSVVVNLSKSTKLVSVLKFKDKKTAKKRNRGRMTIASRSYKQTEPGAFKVALKLSKKQYRLLNKKSATKVVMVIRQDGREYKKDFALRR